MDSWAYSANATEMAYWCDFCFLLESDRPTDIPDWQLRANCGNGLLRAKLLTRRGIRKQLGILAVCVVESSGRSSEYPWR